MAALKPGATFKVPMYSQDALDLAVELAVNQALKKSLSDSEKETP